MLSFKTFVESFRCVNKMAAFPKHTNSMFDLFAANVNLIYVFCFLLKAFATAKVKGSSLAKIHLIIQL